MIEEKCSCCGIKRNGRWGLLFSVPDKDGNVKKYHICPDCFESIKDHFLIATEEG